MKVLDYGRSFSLATGPGTEPRFGVESRTRISDERTGETFDYIRTASCKAEATFGAGGLFYEDNYDGSRIFGPDATIWYRLKSSVRPGWRRDGRTLVRADAWGGPVEHRLVEVEAEELADEEAVVRATHEFLPIVAQTEIWDDAARLRAVIEYPVKTMNTVAGKHIEAFAKDYNPPFDVMDTAGKRGVYQVDTGPVAFADLAMACERHADRVSLAYVAFNAPDMAHFIILAPTPVRTDGAEGEEVCKVHHYSRRVSLPARNRLYAIAM